MTERLKNGHPGWAIYFADNSWMCEVHGIYPVADPFYATTYDSKESAERSIKDYIRQHEEHIAWKLTQDPDYISSYILPEMTAIVAWEVMCSKLIFDIKRLEAANKVTPSKLYDIQMSLEDAISTLKGAVKDLEND
jgi:hypothetical protein